MILSLLLVATLSCGVERGTIKHLMDLAASQVVLTPVGSTIAVLTALPVKSVRGSEARGVPSLEEFHTYTVEGTITAIKHEADQDLHIVLTDGPAHMIVESVDPRCALSSPVLEQMRAVRSTITSALGYRVSRLFTPSLQPMVGKRVRATGVVFFDVLHGQTGVAANGIELHPVLSLEVIR